MVTSLLAFYLQWNLLLAAAWIFWLVLKPLTLMRGFDPGQRRLLQLARGLFAGAVLLFPLLKLMTLVLPAASGWMHRMSTGWFAGELAVLPDFIPAAETPDGAQFFAVLLPSVLLLLLLGGLLREAVRLAQQWLRLRTLVTTATEWKSVHGTQLLISSAIHSPFATRALGRRQIVLPDTLLAVPAHLRLAVQHELQHVRNGDLDWLLLLEGMRLLCFWNPAVRLWHREFEQLHELACDEALVAVRRIDVEAYGECLLAVAEQNALPPLMGASNMVPGRGLPGKRRSALRRRIMKLTDMRCITHDKCKTLVLGVVLGAGLLGSGMLVIATDAVAQPEEPERREYLPVKIVNPRYPQEALQQQLEGWAQVQFIVDENGKVVGPVIVDSCAGAALDTCTLGDHMFTDASLAAIRQFEFQPRRENGRTVRTEGVQYVFRFNLDK